MIHRQSDEGLDLLIKESIALKEQLLEVTGSISDFAIRLKEQIDVLEAEKGVRDDESQ